jgi:crotonobetainyl-CoA:carnitine CoA-transferase CaiB-like acyl-CoA transferase
VSRIIDLGGLAGAYAARLLAEAGHDIIRIDSANGDRVRRTGPFLGDKPGLESGSFHQFLNAGKRSLCLNLQSPDGSRLFKELLGQSDALIIDKPAPILEPILENMKTDFVSIEVVEDENEICAYAGSGLLSLTGQADRAPSLLGGHMIYLAVGTYVAVGAATALFVLQQTGKGQTVTVSMRDSLETIIEQAMVEYTFSQTRTERRGSRGAITAISGAIPCRDGHWVISQINRPGRWEKFAEWVGDPDLMADPSLGLDENQRQKRDFIMDRVLAWANQYSKSELVEEGQRRHFPASPVSTALDLANDPQLIARGYLTEMDHPEFGKTMFPHGAIASVRGKRLNPAPTIGQHNNEILAEVGYSESDYRTFVELGAM